MGQEGTGGLNTEQTRVGTTPRVPLCSTSRAWGLPAPHSSSPPARHCCSPTSRTPPGPPVKAGCARRGPERPTYATHLLAGPALPFHATRRKNVLQQRYG